MRRRLRHDVLSDLHARGLTSTPTGTGNAFRAGFAVWPMGGLSAQDLDPTADDDGERAVAEGVSVAPYAYFNYTTG
ncbi:hypothetical protein [Streptomyces sp. ISL-11]|uniref:hypothetical protein n=1 Tax=Streptomyces sp. ISL-11 TaxID=2819174 RepID=UPI001BE87446|nr:hypothetical protein [Streptomyces sp. ISL-11]MBT2384567.1 hypothetical protein [Streptomyces sp. ISL-11]